MTGYARGGEIQVAVGAIVIAALSNTIVKALMVMVLGAPALRRPILIGAAAIVVAGLAATLLT